LEDRDGDTQGYASILFPAVLPQRLDSLAACHPIFSPLIGDVNFSQAGESGMGYGANREGTL